MIKCIEKWESSVIKAKANFWGLNLKLAIEARVSIFVMGSGGLLVVQASKNNTSGSSDSYLYKIF